MGRASRNLSPGRILFDWLTLGKEPFRCPWRLAKRFADNKLRGTFPPKSAELSKRHGKPAFRPGQAPTPTAAGGRLCLQPQQLRGPCGALRTPWPGAPEGAGSLGEWLEQLRQHWLVCVSFGSALPKVQATVNRAVGTHKLVQ